MRPSDLKALNEKNGGNFFNAATMAFWGDTMRNFRLRDNGNGTVTLYRAVPNRRHVQDEYIFDKATGLKLQTVAKPSAETAAA